MIIFIYDYIYIIIYMCVCIHLWVILPLYNTSIQFGDLPAMFDDTEGNASATRTECTLRLRYHENFGVPGAQKRGESPIDFFLGFNGCFLGFCGFLLGCRLIMRYHAMILEIYIYI